MPSHDLTALWEEHTHCEFETRDVDATMATMVSAPYVNHVPTMTGGVGHDELKRFYKYHLIGANPPDTTLTLISGTVGTDSHALMKNWKRSEGKPLGGPRRESGRPHPS